MRVLYVLVAALLCGAPREFAQTAQDPWVAMKAQVVRFTGANPVDCGQFRDDRVGPPLTNQAIPDEVTLQKALDCATEFAAKKLPFWTAAGAPGIDTFSGTGLLGQKDGSIHLFTFCAGTYCPSAFSMRWCLAPEVRGGTSGNAFFGCARWASGGRDGSSEAR